MDTSQLQNRNNRVPAQDVGTVPNYSTLPANASKFNYSQSTTIASDTASGSVIFTKEVPVGFVMYARRFQVNITAASSSTDPSWVGIPDADLTVSIQSNKNVSPFNQSMILRPLDSAYDFWLIADQREKVNIIITYDFSALTPVVDSVTFLARLSGDMLQVNDKPAAYNALSHPDPQANRKARR